MPYQVDEPPGHAVPLHVVRSHSVPFAAAAAASNRGLSRVRRRADAAASPVEVQGRYGVYRGPDINRLGWGKAGDMARASKRVRWCADLYGLVRSRKPEQCHQRE